MPREHYYGLTAEGPNATRGLEYIYLGCFENIEEANDMAKFQQCLRIIGHDIMWISTKSELEALEESIKNHLTNPPEPISFES